MQWQQALLQKLGGRRYGYRKESCKAKRNISVTQGTGLELRVITSTIIGGASLQGGEGSVLGAFLGSLLMALITNALNLLGVDVYWHTFVTGATLLLAVLIDQMGKNRKAKVKA